MDAAAPAAGAFAPRASLSHFPPDYAEHIASALGAEPGALTTLTISRDTPPVYAAIVEYAAQHAAARPAAGPHHLWLSQRSPFEPAELLDDADSGGDGSDGAADALNGLTLGKTRLSRHALRRMRHASDVQPGRGIREVRTHPYVPRLRLDLGEAVVLWPPPPHLTAAAARKKRRELVRVACAANELVAPPKKWRIDADGAVQELSEPEKAPTATNGGDPPWATRPAENGGEHDGGDEQQQPGFEVFVAQYELALPMRDANGSLDSRRSLLVACAHGAAALTHFLSGVAAWAQEKDRQLHQRKLCYELYRFRSDDCGSYWEAQGHRHARPLHSVVLVDGQMEAILRDVTSFLQPSTRRWFASHGLSHRRSYLFYGRPGTGKTSTIRAIAGEFGLNCCFLSMTDAAFSNQNLFDALRGIPSNALLVLEDVDSLFNSDRSSKSTPSLTFSGVLNALDGVASSDGVITVMTTNHMERLETALIRGGRVDRRFHFDWPSERQLARLFETYYEEAPPELATAFARAVFERREGTEARSIATLQQLFVYFREQSPEHCVARMDEFFEMHFPTPPEAGADSLYS